MANAEEIPDFQTFVGSYKMTSSENFDEYLNAIGVGFLHRKLAATATPVQELGLNEEEFTLKTVTTFNTYEIKFKLEQPFEETTPDGRSAISTFSQDGNKLIQIQKSKPKDVTVVREFSAAGMTMTMTVSGDNGEPIVCTRIFKKQ